VPLIVIPADEPAVVSVSAAYARLNGMDVRTYAVAEHALTLMLAAARQIVMSVN
jgi:lactate dehydrogenase-like 2-hydroxyacid dehydrogenase